MKKCNQCKIVFHSDDRETCLYCDRTLADVEKDDTVLFQDDSGIDPNVQSFGFRREVPVTKEVLRDWQMGEYLRAQYMVGSYFKVRTFMFMYIFSRNQYRMGKGYKRLLVQPLNWTAFLIIPWVFIDLVDTVNIRLTYNAYCPKCGWKFRQVHATQEHDSVECEYNAEYSKIVNDIASGTIARTEGRIKQESFNKMQAGKNSAYRDLCLTRRTHSGWVMDVFCIWFSICLLMTFVVILVLPFFMHMTTMIQV